jgi:2-oxoglutarate ferredoxin oxidoreductase subunit alpha
MVHLRHLNPMPPNLGEVLARYRNIIVPEINTGQLAMLLRAHYLVDARTVSVVQGRGFHVEELVEGIRNAIEEAGR